MITYSVSPYLKPVKFQGKQLPTIKQLLFFATSDEYITIQNNNTDKPQLFTLNTPTNHSLIRANSVVEYGCGITLNDENEIDDVINKLLLQGKCPPKQHSYYDTQSGQVVPAYSSEYHLEHNYKKAQLNDQQKGLLINNYKFLDTISTCGKNFVLNSIGVNLSKDMIKNSKPDTKDTKGRHIVIIYKDATKDNDGYLKFKKPDNSPPKTPTSEISQFSEHDAIYVNIHFTKGANSDFEAQLQNIGQNFSCVATSTLQNLQISGPNYYENQNAKTYFTALQTNFSNLVNFVFDPLINPNTCQDLYNNTKQVFKGCYISVGKIPISGPKPKVVKIDFDSNNTKHDFLSLDIYPEKLAAPTWDLRNILSGIQDSESDDEDNQGAPELSQGQNNEENDTDPLTLIQASALGKTDEVQLLLDQNANPFATNDQHYTALTAALEGGHINLAKKFIQDNFNIENYPILQNICNENNNINFYNDIIGDFSNEHSELKDLFNFNEDTVAVICNKAIPNALNLIGN